MKLVGLDIGTTTISGLVLDADDGRILSVRTENNPSGLPGSQPWESLQDPDAALGTARQILEDALAAHKDVGGIGVAGQMHGILYVDKAGNAVSPLYTWRDGRGDIPREASDPRAGTYTSFASSALGRSLSTGMGTVTHFFNTERGLIPKSARMICTVADYVVMKLAGSRRPVMDATNAASLGGFDLESLSFDGPGLRKIGCDPSFFPDVRTDYSPAGEARQGIPVFPALGDNQASFLGSISDPGRMALVNVGTGSQFSLFVPGFRRIDGIDMRPLPFGGYIGVGAGLCGGLAYAALRRFFRSTLLLLTGRDREVSWEALNGMSAPAAEEPLLVDTRFSGTRAAPGIRGSITNINLANFTPEHLAVGVREGIVSELHGFSRLFDAADRRGIDAIVGSGNAVRLSEPLRASFEKRFGVPLRVPRHREETSFGAALVAGIASGIIADRAAAGALVRYEDPQSSAR